MLQLPQTLPCPRALALAFAAIALPLLACCSYLDCDTVFTAYKPSPPTPYYSASAFHRSGGRYWYDDGSSVAQTTGMDVSDHQGDIDWNAVAADGIDFVFLRVGYRGTTEGGLYPDERFAQNLLEAQEAGIACGAYFFSQATSAEEAAEEAAYVLELLADSQLDYPVGFDYEVSPSTRIANVDAQTASLVATTFCEQIRAGGYEPMIYGNTYDLAQFDSQVLESYATWCAEYDDGPSYDRKAAIWQYTNQGIVNGIGGLCDLNLDLRSVP